MAGFIILCEIGQDASGPDISNTNDVVRITKSETKFEYVPKRNFKKRTELIFYSVKVVLFHVQIIYI